MLYGDTSIIRENWSAMQRWMNHVQKANPNSLWLHDHGDDFGDWLAIGSVTSKDLIATAYWAYGASLMSQMAAAVNKPAEAQQYRQLSRNIRAAFDRAYLCEAGWNGGQWQPDPAMFWPFTCVASQRAAASGRQRAGADIKAHQLHCRSAY